MPNGGSCLRQLFTEQNILQKHSRHTAMRYANSVKQRLQPLGKAFIEAVIQASDVEYKPLLLLALIIHTPVLPDFMQHVVAETKRVYKPNLASDAWDTFLEDRTRTLPVLSQLSDSTLQKSGNNIIRVLVEVGYLDNNRSRRLQPIYLLPDSKHWLHRLHQDAFEPIMAATEALANVFAEKGDILKNQLTFDKTTTASLNGYTDAPSFVDNYPFVPYHYPYPLVQKVFESIRTKGATGKHLAMGERSLLDAFQSAAKQVKDQGIGVLIPFYCFYSPIESFLEPAVKRTIDQACELSTLTEFDSKILKTLFLIRYVDVLKSTLDNLVTLSIEQIDADKISLKKQIEESLNRLELQLLIARNGDEFIFLANEEKEIENEIQHTDVEPSELTNKLSNIIFDGLLSGETKYRYPLNNQDFPISRFCNGHPRDGASLEDLVVKAISPLDVHYDRFLNDQACLSLTLEGEGCVLVKLPDHPRIFGYKGLDGRDLARFIKTDRFLKQNSGQRHEQAYLLREKQLENIEREKRLRHDLEQVFAEAQIYAIGAKLQPKVSAPSTMLDKANKYVIENTFAKLNLLRPTPGDVLREPHSVLIADDIGQLGFDIDGMACNPEATREVELFISLKIERNEAVYLRDIINRFSRRPFGWHENEILLLVARLGLAGKIIFNLNGELPLKRAYEPFTSVRKRGEIRIQKIRQHDERQIKNAATLVKNVFNKTFTGAGEKELAELMAQALNKWQDQLKSFRSKAQTGHFPGKQDIEQGLTLVADVLEQTNSFNLIQRSLEQASALEHFAEAFEDLDDFYNSQFQTWQTLAKALNDPFKANRPSLEKDGHAKKALDELTRIYGLDKPYDQLRHINPLIEQVQKINEGHVLEKRQHVQALIDQRIERVQSALVQAGAPDTLRNQALHPLQLCKKRIETSDSIPQIISEQVEAENHEVEAEQLINRCIEGQPGQNTGTRHSASQATTQAHRDDQPFGSDGQSLQNRLHRNRSGHRAVPQSTTRQVSECR